MQRLGPASRIEYSVPDDLLDVRRGSPSRRAVLSALRFVDDSGMHGMRDAAVDGRPVLRVVRNARSGHGRGARPATDTGRPAHPGDRLGTSPGHRPVRRSRRVHDARREPRRRGRPRAPVALLRAVPGGHRPLRRHGREVHRRRGDGRLGRADRARRRRRTRGPRRARPGRRRPRARSRASRHGPAS